jgi:dienelactone hydrolase
MQLRIACTQCATELLVPGSAAGKAARCPGCQSVVRVPQYFQAKPIATPKPSTASASLPAYAPAPVYQPAYNYPSNGNAKRKKPKSKRGGSSAGSGAGMRILMIGMAFIGILFVGGMLLVAGLAMFGKQTIATLSPTSVPAPQLPDLGVARPIPGTNSTFQFIQIKQGSGPGQTMQFRVYLPATQAPAQSIPCVLLAPAGTNLLHGNPLDGDDYHDEALPYSEAGMAVVCFSLDGEMTVDESAGDRAYGLALSVAYRQFMAAKAGVVNGRNAFEFALAKLPQVNPKMIYTAGHSSAATVSLLMAANEERLAGSIAFAPITDLSIRLDGIADDPSVRRTLPGIATYLRTGSPATYVERFKCPLFVFHARDDSNEPFQNTERFVSQLKAQSAKVDFAVVNTGDHYDSMIQSGIPQAISWIRNQPR